MGFFGSSLAQIPDLTGKVALVTGANTGMGYTIAEQLAIHGAKVFMGARSEEKAKQAIAKFNTEHQNTPDKGDIVWLPLDLTHPADVAASAKSFLSQVDRLDILASAYSLTRDGIETLVATNHIGHFVLTEALLPLLRQTAQLPGSDVRVVTVSSDLHTYVKDIQLETKADLNKPFSADPATNDGLLATTKRYNLTKLLNVLFASELQRRADQEAFIKPGLRWFGKTPEQGAESALFAATSPEVRAKAEKYKGSYLGPGGKLSLASETGRDGKLAQNLWTLSEKTVHDILGEKGAL
ncbi:hypothetical protein VTL71DRAFT_9187 [Oculimacula yallundae]|uniref:NAD(P)-binding protein n=1 Tax=Oculimacula yallundae TaxID=86028 RepID=A0ABR4BTK9_9HELO